MKLKVSTLGIDIIPENEIDQVYIEHFLNMKEDGDYIKLVRKNCTGLLALYGITTTHDTPKREVKPT